MRVYKNNNLTFFSIITLVLFQSVYAASLTSSIKDKKFANFFEEGKGLYLDSKGVIYITSEEKGSVLRIQHKKITSHSLLPKVFEDDDLGGIAITPKQQFVIVNNGSSKVAILGQDYKTKLKFSKSGDDSGELDSPQGVAVSINNRIYVADTGNHKISVFNNQGLYLYAFGNSGKDSELLEKPTHIALDAQENVYVLEADSKNRISIFSRKGQLIKQIKAGDLKSIFGTAPDFSAMTVDLNGVIYFADYDSRKIALFDWKKNAILESFGSLGQSQGQFRHVSQLAVNDKGQLAILDTDNEKVELFQFENTQFETQVSNDVLSYQNQVAVSCSRVYAFDEKKSICIKPEQGLFLIDNNGKEIGRFAEKIKKPTHVHVGNTHVAIIEKNFLYNFSFDNKKIYKIGRYGTSAGGFDKPIFVYAINGLTYVADKNNNRIQVFLSDGLFKHQFHGSDEANSAFETIGQFVVSNQGELFVVDESLDGVVVVSDAKTGKRIEVLKFGTEPYKIEKIQSIDIDQQGRLYVLGKTDANPYSVSVWDKQKVLLRFGSEEGNGISQAFYKPTNIAVLSTSKNSILINNKESQKLQVYNYKEIPQSAFGLKVNGNKKQVTLKWSRSNSKIVSQYVIEAAEKEEGPFSEISSSKNNEKTFDANEVKNHNWFRIISVSGHGLRAKGSKAKQNDYQQVATLFDAKKYTEVVKKSSKLLSLFPDNTDLKYLRAKSLYLNKDYRDAISAFQKLTQYSQFKTEALKLQVQAYYNLEEYLDAKSLVDEVLAEQPKEVQPYLICTELSLVLVDAIGAVTCAEDGLDLHPDHIKLRYLLGKAYIAASINDSAVLEFETILEAQPNDYITRLLIANDLYDLGMYEEALVHFDYVVKSMPSSYEAKNGKAKALIALGDYDGAKSLAIALSGNKKSKSIQADGYYILGQIAFQNRKFTEAVLRLTRASKYDAKAVSAWALLAQSYIEINKLPRGVKTLNKAIKKNPDAFELYQTLGQIELTQEHYPEATKALTKAVDLEPSSLQSQKLLAQSLFASRNYRKAFNHATQAARIAPNDIDVMVLQADIASLQGKVGSAIDYLKTAIALKSSSADLQYRLGRIYQHANIYDSSKQHLEKASGINPSWAAPHFALGDLYLKRRLFDQSIAAYEKAIELDPSEDNRAALNVAFAEQKRALDFTNNAPQLVLQDLNISHVFSAAYKKYVDKPIGNVTLENISAADYGNLTLSFQIKEYMDFPAVQTIESIKGASKQTFDIKAVFNNKILQVDEDTGVQVEVKLSYLRDGQKDDITLTQSMTIYGKNAMVWGDALMVGSFVTPKDDTLRNFVRKVMSKYQPEPGPLNDKIVSAMALFSSLNALGTKYIIDPNTPYASLRDDQVDYVQFPRETLRLKSGDCDDLSVLLSASLENLGIQTALLEVPGHLLMMFDTGLKVEDASLVSRDLSLLAQKDGNIWIPVESTMVANSFSEAWAEGARKYQKAIKENNLGVIALKDAWSAYKPVTLQKADSNIDLPNESLTLKLIQRENKVLLAKSIDRLILPYQAMVTGDPSNTLPRMQIAILYSRFGLYDEAEQAYDELTELDPTSISILNNKGNFYLLQKKYDAAITQYQKAEQINAKDGEVKLNLAMAYYAKGEVSKASKVFNQAASLDGSIKTKYNAFAKLLSN